jgi:hypothetical protein
MTCAVVSAPQSVTPMNAIQDPVPTPTPAPSASQTAAVQGGAPYSSAARQPGQEVNP